MCRIQRVVANLVQNALKYARVASPIAVVVDRRDSMARVSVIDQGPGMAPDEASRVFDKSGEIDALVEHCIALSDEVGSAGREQQPGAA